MHRTHIAALLTGAIVLLVATNAAALPSYKTAFTTRYPAATRLNTCGTCHQNFTTNSPLNDYGDDFENAGGTSDAAAALVAIENADSDGDGTANLAEIQTSTGFFPGWACDDYTQAINPPADLADFVDPTDVGCLGGQTTTTTGVTTTSVTGPTTTLPGEPRCSQPVTSGANPTASDCLFILKTAVGSETCSPACICDVNSSANVTASDALTCLKKAVGQSVTLDCPCGGVTTTTITTTTSTTTTTTGGGNIEAGRADYDARCSSCHAAGSHDPEAELASDLAGEGPKLVPDLGTIDSSMDGILLTEQGLANMEAFLNSLE
jgi:hypothetical protein